MSGEPGESSKQPEAAPSPAPDEARRAARPTRGRWALVGLVVVAALFAVLLGTPGLFGSRVVLDQDVEITSATVTHEVVPGGKIAFALKFAVKHPLATPDLVFVHVESETPNPSTCRLNTEGTPTPAASQWHAEGGRSGEAQFTEQIPVGDDCKPGTYVVLAGFYDRPSGARLTVLEPPIADNRIPVGRVTVVSASTDPASVDSGDVTFTAADMRRTAALATFAPLFPWAGVLFVASLAAAWAYSTRRREDDEEDETSKRSVLEEDLGMAALILPAIPFMLGILAVLEFIKDDAYISFRYAHNLVVGAGLVFNTGERLEGFTNFLWVLVMAPFEAMGLDLFQVCEVLGSVLGITCLVLTARMTAWVNGERKTLSHLWGAFWLATSSSFVLWAKSGLEQPLASLIPIAGAWILWRARDRVAHGAEGSDRKRLERAYLYAGLVMGAGCMTRPELHLLAVLVGLPLVVDAVRRKKVIKAEWLHVAGILAVTVPCHTFRFLYYGTLIPNTFYVKTGTSSLVWHEGIRTLRAMFDFNATGLLVVIAPFAFANRRRLVEKGTMAVICLAFMVYYVKVGIDEMQWHRLYLPALPFLCVLGALGAQNLTDVAVRIVRAGEAGRAEDEAKARNLADVVGWAVFALACWNSFQFTYKEMNGFNGHGDLAGTYHPDMGKFLVRHERPGALVAFQDMGSTPYHAPDINFLDFFGLVDKTVAHARHDFGLHTFVEGTDPLAKTKFDAAMRDYFFSRNPEWAILTIYTPKNDMKLVKDEFDRDPTGALFGDAYNANDYQFDIYRDPRFRARYVPVRTWPRSAGYYLCLWRRRDLWVQTPREVVLDAAPSGLSGATGTFDGGLELLGTEMTEEALERHEAFVTTWWKLPGPMPADTYIFVHFTKEGFQAADDHVPGDWMWPADRWQAGQILEDRTLFQLPPFTMSPGKYRVYMGVYQRSTGTRLKVTSDRADTENRVFLGTLVVKPRYALIEQLIPPTNVKTMRKYPDRILDPKRAPGT